MMDMDTLAFTAGVIIGALVMGVVIGLVPLICGIVKRRIGLGLGGFAACIVGSLILGVFLSIPMCILFTILIFVLKRNTPAQSSPSAPQPGTSASYAPRNDSVRKCAKCGAILSPGQAFCPQCGAAAEQQTWESAARWGELPQTVSVRKGENLFPRIDLEKELKELEAAAAPAAAEPKPAEQAEELGFITIDDFDKVKFVTAKVLACEAVPKSKKLLKFTLDCGEAEPRQILSGIHEYYEPEELVGKTVVACTNLAPRKRMGQMSNGMLISAVKEEPDGSEKLHLLMLDDKVPAGYGLC